MSDVTDAVEHALAHGSQDAEVSVREAPQHARLLGALASERLSGRLTATDFAVLLRAALRESSVLWQRDGLWVPEGRLARFTPRALARHGLQVVQASGGRVRLRALPWSPDWLIGKEGVPEIERQLFSPRAVAQDLPVAADPFLLRVGHKSYASEAQREAVRTVVGAAPGDTIVVLLPTGAGKTICGILPSVLPLEIDGYVDSDRFGVTPFVVPTVSLALDLQRRVAAMGVIPHATAFRPQTDEADAIRARIQGGTQGPVFASPEAIVDGAGLRHALLDAAERGFLRFLVIDEAHMVATWGDEFRPAFQRLATTCRELRAATAGRLVVVLMSATLTAHGLGTLRELFADGDRFHVVHAVRLRPEPRYVWRRASSASERKQWMLDAIAQVPRPAILYTTRQQDALSWHAELRELGYRRLGLMHGGSTDYEREQALEGWSTDTVDLMIATSAFGLGVDKRDVRAVLHATFPESLDRYYQEVGRGGRDGRPSLSLMVWTKQDVSVAHSLALPKFISIERGSERWQAMFTSRDRVSLGDGEYLVPTNVSPSTREEDIDMQGEANERWNQRTLLLLQRAGAITMLGEEGVERTLGRHIARVKITEDRHLEDEFWAECVLPMRQELLAAYHRDWGLMRAAVTERRCLAYTLQEQYTLAEPQVDVVRACGSCPYCRAQGQVTPVGPLRARHTPRAVELGDDSSPRLREILPEGERGFIFIEAGNSIPDRLLPLAEWFVHHGLRDFVLSPALASVWREHFASPRFPCVFFHEERMRGIRQRRRAAVFLLGGNVPTLAQGSFLVLPEDVRDADRPDRRLVDVVGSRFRWSLAQFEDRYIE